MSTQTTPTRRQIKSASASAQSIQPAFIAPAPQSSIPPSTHTTLESPSDSPSSRKRKTPSNDFTNDPIASAHAYGDPGGTNLPTGEDASSSMAPPAPKKGRTNTPWTPDEERRLKMMREAGNNWSEIAKTFPTRTEGSVKKHWYKDMHYAEFAEDDSAALLAAIREYDGNKWKVIGAKLGKPAKACEQYAKEHFSGRV
ncbi:hypothetical protein MMC25_007381 [Agyrium rufum]|nr:hypothetical protein [Agyrium rufum]